MYREKDIVHENGKFFVLKDKQGFHVMRSGLTYATGDSAYADLSLAITRCDFLASRNK